MPVHHPGEVLLLDYAAGNQDEPVSLLVATHLALCPDCRATVEQFERVGGAMIEELEASPLEAELLERVLGELDGADPEPGPTRPTAGGGDAWIPRPLRDYLSSTLDDLDWRNWPGFKEHRLLPEDPGYTTRILSVGPAKALPRHDHEGPEYSLVLSGGFSDAGKHFLAGDVEVAEPPSDHQPVADPDGDCICLTVTSGPLRLTGPLLRVLNPVLKI